MASKDTSLTADYSSPDSQHNFNYPLPTNTNLEATKDVTDFLVKLRESTIQMQKDVNAFLTQKMDEDKAKDSAQNGKVDEDKEEDMYGEEADDED